MVQDQHVRVRRDGDLSHVRLAVGDAQRDDRLPQGGVEDVEVHVPRGVPGQVAIAGLGPVPAQDFGQPAPS